MRLMRNAYVTLVALTLLIPVIRFDLFAYAFKSIPDLRENLVQELEGQPCTKLLSVQGPHGCESKGVIIGDLVRLVHADDHLAHTGWPRAVMLSPNLLLSFLERLRRDAHLARRIGGILIERPDPAHPLTQSFSPLPHFPQVNLSLTPDSDYVWNPFGSGDVKRHVEVPLVMLSEDASKVARARAQENLRRGNHSWPKQAIRFSYKMKATESSSLSCLKAGTCLPLGGYSVWATLPRIAPPSNSSTESWNSETTTPLPAHLDHKLPVVLVLAKLDAASLFHGGAHHSGDLSGLLVGLAVVDILGRWGMLSDPQHKASPTRRLAFSFLGGEDWGYLGSRQLIRSLQSGDLDVQLDDIEVVLELGALGLKHTPAGKNNHISQPESHEDKSDVGIESGANPHSFPVFVHSEKSVQSQTKTRHLLSSLHGGSNETGVKFQIASSTNPGAPPGSLTPFLKLLQQNAGDNESSGPGSNHTRVDFSSAVVAEFNEQFVNPYVGSELDSAEVGLDFDRMGRVSFAIARFLAGMAFGQDLPGEGKVPSVEIPEMTDDTLITTKGLLEELAGCLLAGPGEGNDAAAWSSSDYSSYDYDYDYGTDSLPDKKGMQCPLVTSLISPQEDSASHYIGVMGSLPDDSQDVEDKKDVTRFIWNFVANRTGERALQVHGNGREVREGKEGRGGGCVKKCQSPGEVCVGTLGFRRGTCVNATVSYTLALSPSLNFSKSNQQWEVDLDLLGDDPLYTESFWKSDIGTKSFLMESASRELTIFIAGAVITIVAGLAAYGASLMYTIRMRDG